MLKENLDDIYDPNDTNRLYGFLSRFIVYRNCKVRLWVKNNEIYDIINYGDNEGCVIVDDILNNKCPQSDYKNNLVIGLDCIVTDDLYIKDAINIILE